MKLSYLTLVAVLRMKPLLISSLVGGCGGAASGGDYTLKTIGRLASRRPFFGS
jgi:hypothetical protein